MPLTAIDGTFPMTSTPRAGFDDVNARASFTIEPLDAMVVREVQSRS